LLLQGNLLIGGERAEGAQELLDCFDLFVGTALPSKSKSAFRELVSPFESPELGCIAARQMSNWRITGFGMSRHSRCRIGMA
jgi:hypothetical protein